MAWIVSAGYALALFAGQFEGSGNVCHGTLALAASGFNWRTLVSNCSADAPNVIARNIDDKHPVLVFEVEASAGCAFRVIKLETEDKSQQNWTVTGYASVADFKNAQLAPQERLECAMHKVERTE